MLVDPNGIVVLPDKNPDNKAREQVHYAVFVPDNYIS